MSKNIEMKVLGSDGNYENIYPIPAGHASSHASGGSDPITPAAIGAAASNHNHGAQSINPSSIELNPGTSASHGGYIDFHYKGSTKDYTSHIIEDASGQIRFEAPAGVVVPITYDIDTATVRNILGGTTDLVAGSTGLSTGCIYLVYE